jgi:hypothetical protein
MSLARKMTYHDIRSGRLMLDIGRLGILIYAYDTLPAAVASPRGSVEMSGAPLAVTALQ